MKNMKKRKIHKIIEFEIDSNIVEEQDLRDIYYKMLRKSVPMTINDKYHGKSIIGTVEWHSNLDIDKIIHSITFEIELDSKKHKS